MRTREAELHITFADPEQLSNFVIDELTLFIALDAQPHTTSQKLKRAIRDSKPIANTEMWLELVIRNTRSADTIAIPAPVVSLSFANRLGAVPVAHCGYLPADERADIPQGDINRLMHADIWYSFVREADFEHEFMQTGYRDPVRLLYKCPVCAGNIATLSKTRHHCSSQEWLGTNTPNLPAEFRDVAQRLADAAMRFGAVAICGPQTPALAAFKIGSVENHHSSDWKVPIDDEQFARVSFDWLPELLNPYRFGIRRMPWRYTALDDRRIAKSLSQDRNFDPQRFLHGPSWGGTVEIQNVPGGVLLTPMAYRTDDGEAERAVIPPSHAIRFWIRWKDRGAISASHKDDRLAVSYELNVDPALGYVNAFVHAPVGHSYVAGSSTPFNNFSVPRRLFAVWTPTDPERSYAWSKSVLFERDSRIELGAEFIDTESGRHRLIDAFILSQLAAVCTAIALTPPPMQKTAAHLVDGVTFGIAASCFAATTAFVYSGRRFRWFGVIGLAFSLKAIITHTAEAPPIVMLLAIALLTCGIRWSLVLHPIPGYVRKKALSSRTAKAIRAFHFTERIVRPSL